jgi:hypothetical protein
MDIKNPYESPVTFKLHRAEYLVAFATTIVLMLVHFHEIRWVAAIGLFLYIDLIGYIPGAIAYRRSADGRIPKFYYVLYNSMHSLITCGVVAGLWMLFIGPEWALLAIAFHVFGDRGVFGNFLKPFGQAFEPVDEPLYERLAAKLRARSAGDRVPAAAQEEAELVGAAR